MLTNADIGKATGTCQNLSPEGASDLKKPEAATLGRVRRLARQHVEKC